MRKKLTPLPEPRTDRFRFDHQKTGKSSFQTFNMADLRKLVFAVSVLSSLTVVLQLAFQILSLYLLQLQRQQDFLTAQIALRENACVSKGRQKRPGQRKPRASWKKPGRTDRWWINLCLLYTSPSPRDLSTSRMPSSA